MDDCKHPDIVRSNSSSDEKSLEIQLSNHTAAFKPEVPDAGRSSVSSFSSTGCSKKNSSSTQEPDTKARRSNVGLVNSLGNDLLQPKASVAREGSRASCFYKQDSVFAQESTNVPDGPLHNRPWQHVFSSRQIPSPVIETSLTSKENDPNHIPRCSEKGQEARSRFSSSGYGTGSGESSQGTSASKTSVHSSHDTSVHLSQESSPVDTLLQRAVGNSNVARDEPKNAEVSKAASPNTAVSNSGVSLHIENPDSLKPAFLCTGYSSKGAADESLSSKRVLTTHGVKHSFSVGINGPGVTSELQTAEYKLQNISVNINPQKIERQSSSVGGQNLRQPQMNPAIQNLTSSQAGAVSPSMKHSLSSTLLQNTGQTQESLDQQRQSQININDGIIQSPQTGATCIYPMGLRQQEALVSNGKLNASYDCQNQARLLSIQHHPPSSGSLGCTTAPMSSSSSSGSYLVPLSVENKWAAEPSHASLAKCLLLQSGSVASESSEESRYNLESLLKSGNQLIHKNVHSSDAGHFPVFHQQLPESLNRSVLAEMLSNASSTNDELPGRDLYLWEKLQRSVRCNEINCSVPECAQIKAIITALENERCNVSSLTSSFKNLLLTMFNHMAYVCDHPKCPFLWCGERIDNLDLTPDECLLIMKQRMENFAEHCRLLRSPVKYMKLKTSFPYNSMPEEDLHWIRLCMMGTSRRTLLVKPLQFNSSDPLSDSEYWVIKKVYLTDEGDNWSVYSRLREVKHRSVVSMLWAAAFEDHLLVCSVYEGFSLNDYLPSLPSSQSRFIPVFCIMQQLISAARHISSLGIVYLNWTSENILVTYHSETYFLVKLSNFSCSVLLERPDGRRPSYDGGYLRLALPWHVVTPELKNDFKVEYVSDVWGIGCLLHELATGYSVWHEHRHQDFVASLVGTQPQVPRTCPELSEMFTACWQLDPSKRVPMNDLEIMLIQAFSHHLGS
ncbi:unnamed protein product [Candidula unifasciata]|uniref:Protein kinase domain-containing protein n=1 Tax=Candidula unifasciata TaxID=100452 RepID=A0A8S3YPJ9_9EUPU|nr:unnamed protein product [Candidula unifasciata]